MDEILISYRYPRGKVLFLSCCFFALAALFYPYGPLEGGFVNRWGPLLGELGSWYVFLCCLFSGAFGLSRLFIKKSTIMLADSYLIAPEKPGKKSLKIFFADIQNYRFISSDESPSLFTLEIEHSTGTLLINSQWLPSEESADTITQQIERYRIGRKAALTAHNKTVGATRHVHSMLAYNQKLIEKMEHTRRTRPLNELEQRYLDQLEQEQREHRELLCPETRQWR